MFRNPFFGIALALLPLSACDPIEVKDSDTRQTQIKTCTPDGTCMSSNCDDINQPDQGPGSDFTMLNPETPAYRYKLTGLYPDSAGEWHIRGFHVLQGPSHPPHTPADGTIRSLTVGGAPVMLADVKVNHTELSIYYCPLGGCGKEAPKELSGAALVGTELVFVAPPAPGSGPAVYKLIFGSAPQVLDSVTPFSADVFGYSLSYSVNGSQQASLCAGPKGAEQRAMFYQSAYWNPQTFARIADSSGASLTSSAVTVTCELGAIAACMSWGYKPWEQTETKQGKDTKELWHATCVNAKTANYCGDGYAWTKYGTSILVQDPLQPPVMSEMSKAGFQYKVEALWDEKGASCINDANRRVPGLPWATSSCYNSLPACPAALDLTQTFATGIP